MKIDKISVYNNRSFKTNNTPEQNIQYNLCNGKMLEHLEMLGRSQVNFTGNKFIEYDKQFVDVLSKNLRLSQEDKEKLEDGVAIFLKNNNLKTLEDITGAENYELQSKFIGKIGCDICKSDNDYEILKDAFFDRVDYVDKYEPKLDLYQKDYVVVEHILDKYNISERDKGDIFSILKDDADGKNFNTLFDIFKPENNPESIVEYIQNLVEIDSATAFNLLIDFGVAAQQDEKTLFADVNPWKLTAKNFEESKDSAIAQEILDEFEIDENEYDYICEQINKRREGISVEQISFELTDKYDLPSKAFKYITDTIYNYDGCNEEF